MRTPDRRTRRALLGALGTAATAGCLRLTQDADGGDAAANTGEAPSDEVTDTPQPTTEESETATETTEAACWYPVTFDFSDVHRPDENSDDWALSFACYELTVLGEQGQELVTYNVGGEDSDLRVLSGAYQPAAEADYRNGNSFRWFGTPDARTELLVGPFAEHESPAALLFRGDAPVADITATVSVGGATAATVSLDASAGTHEVAVPGDATCGLN